MAAISLGAQGIQMGTRMVSSKESPVHENWKNAIMSADDQSTVLLNRFSSPALRALRTDKTNKLEKNDDVNAMQEFGTVSDPLFWWRYGSFNCSNGSSSWANRKRKASEKHY